MRSLSKRSRPGRGPFDLGCLPLLAVLGPEVAQHFADLHRSHGVDLRLGSSVTADVLAEADLVVVGIGAAPRTQLAEAAGLEVDGGVLVDELLRTSDDHVLAIGDIASEQHPVLGRRVRVASSTASGSPSSTVAVHAMRRTSGE